MKSFGIFALYLTTNKMIRILLISLIALLASCNSSSSGGTNQTATPAAPTEADYCASINTALNGVFRNPAQEGTMTWTGGTTGSVEIKGVDYNEMTCTYTVPNCEEGMVSMICNTSMYDTYLQLYTADSMLLGTTTYVRVK